jgi:hypothetical protein
MGEFYSGWLLVFGLVISRRSAICAAENDIDDNLNMCATSLSELCMLAILRAKMSKKRKTGQQERSVNQIEEDILEAVTTKFVERVASLSDTEKAPLIDKMLHEEDEDMDLYDSPSVISRHIEDLGKMFNISTNMVVDDDGGWGSPCCVLKLDDDEKKKKEGRVELPDYEQGGCGTAAVGMPANSFNVSEKDITSLKFVSTVLGLNDIQTSPADLEDYDQSSCVTSIHCRFFDDKRRKEFTERREENERKARALSREPQWIHIGSVSYG